MKESWIEALLLTLHIFLLFLRNLVGAVLFAITIGLMTLGVVKGIEMIQQAVLNQ